MSYVEQVRGEELLISSDETILRLNLIQHVLRLAVLICRFRILGQLFRFAPSESRCL